MGTNICIIDNSYNLIERRYTMATEAQLRAIKKWSTEKVDEIKIRVPKGQKHIAKAHAEKQGESLNSFISRAITETMERDNTPDTTPTE